MTTFHAIRFWAVAIFLSTAISVSGLPLQQGSGIENAKQLFQSGKLKEATAILSKVIASQPELEETYPLLIRYQIEANDLNGAQRTTKQALQRFPKSSSVTAAAGDFEFRISKFPEAAVLYREALQFDPMSARSLLGLGRLNRLTSMNRSARNLFERAYALDPKDPDIVHEWAYMRNTPSEIAVALEEYLRLASFKDEDYRNAVKRSWAVQKYFGERTECRVTGRPIPETFELTRMSRPEDLTKSISLGILASINGAKPERIKLQESGGVVVTAAYAEQLRLPRIVESPHDTPYGIRKNDYVAFADRIRVGNFELQNCPVTVKDAASVYGDVQGPLAAIGLDLFTDFIAKLDFSKNLLTLLPTHNASEDDAKFSDAELPENENNFTRLLRVGSTFLVPTHLNGGPEVLFTLSFGLPYSLASFNLPEAKTLGLGSPPGPVGDNSKCNSSCGEVKFDRFTVKRTILRELYDRMSYVQGFEISGSLGYNALQDRTVTFDYRNGLLKFD